ncbi:MAG: T9SS type A sorting domain-containing protein [Ignavibacteriaceae bacterium]|nr:T9SS type A sorting domain-containing protein [Ignavibacteriaceae bacterium]
MTKFTISLLLFNLSLFAQQDLVGKHYLSREFQGNKQSSFITVPEVNYSSPISFSQSNEQDFTDLFGSMVRWNFTDAAAIGSKCAVSGNEQYNAVGWYLNNQRISLYGNTNSTPIWEYPLTNNLATNFVSLNYDGDLIAAGADLHVYIFNNSNNVPFFDFDVSTLGGGPTTGPVALAQNENFLVATASYTDSSTILGFNTSSTTPVWSVTIVPSTGGGGIQGLRLSGNDSLMIVNTYGVFWVIKTFTGEVVYQDLINPVSTSGTQTNQGISHDGSIIATVNYRGYVRVFEWNGSTYNFLWQDQEPPGIYYNWANSVVVSNNGNYVAVGTLIFVSASEYNGTVKLYKTSNGGTVSWRYEDCGDAVTAVSFNDLGNVLAASSWGAMDNSTPDLYVFKVWEGNTPVFTVNTNGSFFDDALSSDGSTLITSGKAVHARTFGNGGLAYNVFVDTSDTNVPVELESFTGKVSDGNVTLEWTTATEINNQGFEIQRSFDSEFQTIGFVDGHGTTTETRSYIFVDRNVNAGSYIYRLKQMDFNGSYEYSPVVNVDVSAPNEFSLSQNYPNPFNPSTKIDFSLAVDSKVTLKVFDVLGQEVTSLINNNNLEAGLHSVDFDASALNSGIYFYILKAENDRSKNFISIKKMILMK